MLLNTTDQKIENGAAVSTKSQSQCFFSFLVSSYILPSTGCSEWSVFPYKYNRKCPAELRHL